MEKKEMFYQHVADILGADHSYKHFPEGKRNRWTSREAGNGRYGGHGCVRYFSENCVHVMLYNPRIIACFKSEKDALAAISERMAAHG